MIIFWKNKTDEEKKRFTGIQLEEEGMEKDFFSSTWSWVSEFEEKKELGGLFKLFQRQRKEEEINASKVKWILLGFKKI